MYLHSEVWLSVKGNNLEHDTGANKLFRNLIPNDNSKFTVKLIKHSHAA